MSTWFTRCATALVVAAIASANALADPIPPGGQGDRLKVIGFSGLGGHYGAFKMALNHPANGRWYLYMGHSFDLGWSILDVTNPQDPKYVKFIPYDGPKDWITSQVTVHDNLMITSLDRRNAPGPDMIFWDVSDPINPKEIARWGNGTAGAHRNSYPGGKYAYLSTSYAGFRGKILVIVDVSDPAHPKEVGKWWQPGQKDGEPLSGPLPGFHGPANISPDGKMLSTGYTPDVINLDITDPAQPKVIGRLPMTPRGSFQAGSIFPLTTTQLDVRVRGRVSPLRGGEPPTGGRGSLSRQPAVRPCSACDRAWLSLCEGTFVFRRKVRFQSERVRRPSGRPLRVHRTFAGYWTSGEVGKRRSTATLPRTAHNSDDRLRNPVDDWLPPCPGRNLGVRTREACSSAQSHGLLEVDKREFQFHGRR